MNNALDFETGKKGSAVLITSNDLFDSEAGVCDTCKQVSRLDSDLLGSLIHTYERVGVQRRPDTFLNDHDPHETRERETYSVLSSSF